MRTLLRSSLLAALLLGAACGSPAKPAPSAAPRASQGRPSSPPAALGALVEGAEIQGFRTKALYVDDGDRPRGARFVHVKTGFVFDYLQIDSAPQAFLTVSTYPTSDKGEPHTQEHLLLGKGNKGRYLGEVQHARLVTSSAFTAQRWTAYDLMTEAGADAFWPVLHTQLDSLLHPDYSDEEIRREVRDFGIAKQSDGALALQEKGAIYNEMVRTYEEPVSLLWRTALRMLYGRNHPLAFESGGTPEGIRQMTAADIRAFHGSHYQLGNMSMIGAFASSESLGSVLGHVGETLDAFAPSATAIATPDLRAPAGAPAGALSVVDFPYASADHPATAMLAWPATRSLSVADRLALEAFFGAFADGEGSTVYKALVDTKTRELDVGLTGTWVSVDSDQGQPIHIGLENMSAAHADEASLRAVRDVVLGRLRAIAALPDGSKELEELNARVKARIVERRRALDKRLDTPPRFGARDTGDEWYRHLEDLAGVPGFRKRLTHREALMRAEALASSRQNAWRARITQWGLLDVPYGVAMRPSPARRTQLDAERDARLHAEIERLEGAYHTADAQDALRRREAEIARASAEIARAEESVPVLPMLEHPPMTDDDSLLAREETRHGVPLVVSTFDTMKSATVGLALKLDRVPADLLPYLAVLPSLISEVGVVKDGVPIAYDDMRDRLRREILSLRVRTSVDLYRQRAEIFFEASGNDVAESRRAIEWLRTVLTSPDWRAANLPRVRDVVAERGTKLHDVMTGPEEEWVSEAATTIWRQDRDLYLRAASPMTRVRDARRLAWKLEGSEQPAKLGAFLDRLAGAAKTLNRASLEELAKALAADEPKAVPAPIAPYVAAARALPPSERPRAKKAGRDLGESLGDVPDASLARDWADLCGAMKRDAARPPAETLSALTRLLAALRHADAARTWIVGSSAHEAAIRGDVEQLLGALDPSPSKVTVLPRSPRVLDRAAARGEPVSDATFLALVNPSTASTSMVNAAPVAGYDETRDDALVDLMSGITFTGTGARGFYKQIWKAGLAYSGGVGTWPDVARMELYFERCADAPELLRVLDESVRHAPVDPRTVDYALLSIFHSRIGETYEMRGSAFAADLADGNTPAKVRAFRERMLALRNRPDLAQAMRDRLQRVYASILPTLDPKSTAPADSIYVTFGPERLIAEYERALRAARGAKTQVVRLYPRDFWGE